MFDEGRSEHRRHVVRELLAAAATPGARDYRFVLLAAASALERYGSVLDLTAAALNDSNVLQAVHALRRQACAPVTVVYGHEVGDSEGASWVVRVSRSKASCDALAHDLNDLAVRFGQSIGKPDLVGLEPLERSELVSHVFLKDPHVHVGRHGVRWSVESIEVGR